MKKKYIYTLLTALALASCQKTVEVTPLGFVSPSAVTTSVSGLQNVLNSAYDRFQDFSWYGRDFTILGDVQTDNIYTDPNVPSGGGRYVSNNKNTLSSTYGFWTIAYAAILDLNTVIANADASGGSAAVIAQMKGEAYGLRALAYFNLAQAYCYEPGHEPTTGLAANFKSGVVIRLKPTTDPTSGAPQPRASNADTYAQIESDFQTAISFLPATTLTATAKYKMNKFAAEALYGKVLLYESKYPDAVTQFNLALDPSSGASLAGPGTYTTIYNSATPVGESYFEIGFTALEMSSVTGVNNSLHSYTTPSYKDGITSTFGGQTASDELVAALTAAADDRKNEIYQFGAQGIQGAPGTYTGTVFNWCNKYPSPIAPVGSSYADNVKVIRYADVLLMKAEALAAQTQYAAAAALVTQLHVARNNTKVVPTDATVVQYIRDERRLELFFEGQRFFDEKRWGTGLTKPAKTAVGVIAPDDIRLLAPIPATEYNIVGKTVLPQNPGY